MVIKVTDSLGNVRQRSGDDDYFWQFATGASGRVYPGDRLTIEVEVDPMFERASYRLKWSWRGNGLETLGDTNRAIIDIGNAHIDESFAITCIVTSNRDWHRMRAHDDRVIIVYKVLPPLS